jgi:hypothetical protein
MEHGFLPPESIWNFSGIERGGEEEPAVEA